MKTAKNQEENQVLVWGQHPVSNDRVLLRIVVQKMNWYRKKCFYLNIQLKESLTHKLNRYKGMLDKIYQDQHEIIRSLSSAHCDQRNLMTVSPYDLFKLGQSISQSDRIINAIEYMELINRYYFRDQWVEQDEADSNSKIYLKNLLLNQIEYSVAVQQRTNKKVILQFHRLFPMSIYEDDRLLKFVIGTIIDLILDEKQSLTLQIQAIADYDDPNGVRQNVVLEFQVEYIDSIFNRLTLIDQYIKKSRDCFNPLDIKNMDNQLTKLVLALYCVYQVRVSVSSPKTRSNSENLDPIWDVKKHICYFLCSNRKRDGFTHSGAKRARA